MNPVVAAHKPSLNSVKSPRDGSRAAAGIRSDWK